MKMKILSVAKFFLISWPSDVIFCSFIYGPIKYTSTSIALVLHNISPFHEDFKKDLNDEQDEDQNTNFITFLKEHIGELPYGITANYLDEKLFSSSFSKVATTISHYTFLDPIKEAMEPHFLKGSFPAKAAGVYEFGYNGIHLLESLKPSWDILINNKRPDRIITLDSDLKEDLNIVFQYYKFIFDNIVQLFYSDSVESIDLIPEDYKLFTDSLIPHYNDTGTSCDLIA